MWEILTMSECWDIINANNSNLIKPSFPCRRWGNSYSLISTTDKKSIDLILIDLKDKNIASRKKIDKISTNKFNRGTFYMIEIKKEIITKQKRKAGQPKKTDAKQRYATRLHPNVIKIIKEQPNQSAFIEQLVLNFKQ